jgi:hypothetical protein
VEMGCLIGVLLHDASARITKQPLQLPKSDPQRARLFLIYTPTILSYVSAQRSGSTE